LQRQRRSRATVFLYFHRRVFLIQQSGTVSFISKAPVNASVQASSVRLRKQLLGMKREPVCFHKAGKVRNAFPE
jgi:hypothetical protein